MAAPERVQKAEGLFVPWRALPAAAGASV